MRKYICDACGKEVEHEELLKRCNYDVAQELCEKCYKEYIDIIDSGNIKIKAKLRDWFIRKKDSLSDVPKVGMQYLEKESD